MKRYLCTIIFLAIAALPFVPLRAAPAAAPGDSAFGVNSHVSSRHPRFETLEQPLALVKDLSVGWVREDVQWARIEARPGTYDWTWYDKVLNAHRTNGVNVIGVLTPAVGWATPEPGDSPNEVSFFGPDPDLYAAFAKAVATRYRGVVQAWEIWNEPENGIHWRPAPDPAAYAQLLIKASAAIKSVDPQVTVLNGGVVPFDPGFLQALAAHGAWNAFDVLSVHPYVDPFTPETAQIGAVGIDNVRTLAARYGSKPIWVTEFGWGTGGCERDPVGRTNEEAQANYLVRGAALLRGAGAERVLWYNFKDRQVPCYGLIRGAGGDEDYSQAKPAATALRVLSQQVAGAAPQGAQDLMPQQTLLTFDDARGWGPAFPVGKPPLAGSTAQVHGGSGAAQIAYQFTSTDNDYVAFPRSTATPLPANTTRLGLWVYGDSSGHMLQVQLTDEQGEVLQYRLGFLGAPGWQFLSTSLGGEVEPGNRITGGNGRLDGAVRLKELIVDDNPNTATGSGTIYVDDMVAFLGGEVYAQRFGTGGEVVDVIWSPEGSSVQLPSASASATVTERDGASRTVAASGGILALNVGPAPIYVRHVPGSAPPPSPTLPPDTGSDAPTDRAFNRVWASTDLVVQGGATSRSWLWGPAPYKTTREPYAQSPGGQRLVEYYDKSRMEINDPNRDRNDLYFVTNGLLPIELMTGRLKTGDAPTEYQQREPADVPVAGDPAAANAEAPTYQSLGSVATVDVDTAPRRAAAAVGSVLAATLNKAGQVGQDQGLSRHNVRVGSYSEALGHNVADVFGRYMSGLSIDPLFAMGHPISEPYWAKVRVGGVEKDVLMQAFERRVLTYTPTNAEAFQVEMGNVGQHYYRWRYNATPWQR